MGLVRVTPPATQPITMLEAIRHLRLDETMLEPVPSAPSVALAGAGAGNVTAGAHRYCVTFVTDGGAGETTAGDASAPVTVADAAVDGQVIVTGIPVGGSAVTARRLYRTKANADVFYLLATIANNQATTFSDDVADGALGAAVPSTNTTGDPTIASYIAAATEYAEGFQARALVAQQWRLTLDAFPSRYRAIAGCVFLETAAGLLPADDAANAIIDLRRAGIRLPKPPLISVDAVTYIDSNGATQTLDPSSYLVDTSDVRGVIVPVFNTTWPATRAVPNAVSVLFTCGYGDASAVPAATKEAIKLLVGNYFSNREAFIDARFTSTIPFSADSLLWLNRALEAA